MSYMRLEPSCNSLILVAPSLHRIVYVLETRILVFLQEVFSAFFMCIMHFMVIFLSNSVGITICIRPVHTQFASPCPIRGKVLPDLWG